MLLLRFWLWCGRGVVHDVDVDDDDDGDDGLGADCVNASGAMCLLK